MWRRAVFVLWWAMCSLGVQAQQVVEGVRFERDTVVQGQSLVLNGAGLRAMMIIKVYAAGLYLPQVAKTAPQALSAAGAKRVRIVMLRNVSAQRLAGNLLSGVQETTPTTAETQALAPRLETLRQSMLTVGEVLRGQDIALDYVPGEGTRVSVDGRLLGDPIPGADFYAALLRIWLSDDAADQGLRRELLGLPD